MSTPILVVGSVALDTIETPFTEPVEVLGGSAVHFSAAASLFTDVRLVGVVGSDYPTAGLEFLQERGVDLAGLAVASGPSFRWRGRYQLDMDHRDTLALELGVFDGFRPDIPAAFLDTPIVFLGNIDPAIQLDVLDKLPRARLSACDTIDHWIREKREMVDSIFSRVDIVFLNEDEARLYAGTPNLHRAARAVLERGCRAVVIKKGENGAIAVARVAEGFQVFLATAFPLEEVMDPTGAGDAFAGGVMGTLARSGSLDLSSLREAVAIGSVVASFNVEGFGAARLKEVGLEDVMARYRQARELVLHGAEPFGGG